MRVKMWLMSFAVAGGVLASGPVVFDSPVENDRGAMMLGNGEVGAMAWVSADGTLHTRLQRSDSWNEAACHLKVGQIDYVTGRAVTAGSFRQTLDHKAGELTASWTSGGKPVSVAYRLQQGVDFAVCHVIGAPGATAKTVNWRLYPGGTKAIKIHGPKNDEFSLNNEFDAAARFVPNGSFTVNADRLLPDGWYHENRKETVREMMAYYERWQATGDLGKPDLLSNRVFGALTKVDRARDEALFVTAVTCFHPCPSAAAWEAQTRGLIAEKGWTLKGEAAARERHLAAWAEFWNRSHIRLSPAREAAGCAPAPLVVNPKLPLSYGRDSTGENVFEGELVPSPENAFTTNLIRFAATFTTTDAKKSQRLVDNITPGKADGFLVDLYQERIRYLMGRQTLVHPKRISARERHTVAVTAKREGEILFVVDGEVLRAERRDGPISPARACALVEQAWELQRYTAACAGRGNWPIRFNGTLFTAEYKGDPDYRRWGDGYWWQNTRLPYYTMLAAGDVDLMQGLFNLYLPLLDFNLRRTRKYLGHGGAYFPECIEPWGDHFIYVYGCDEPWDKRKDKLQKSGWHKYEWSGQLELSLFLLDRWAYTQDDAWFRRVALPSIREYVRFFDEHYKLGADGRYDWQPAQAVETWWACTTPMPEVAGLTAVTERLLALPKGLLADEDRALFAKIRARIPALPTRRLANGEKAWAPAAAFAKKSNCETPELYCVFPYRLCSFEKPNAALGRSAYAARFDKLYFGWCQDEVNAAYLGMANEARRHLVDRVAHHPAKGYRWPASWGPNFNWVPDQDEGSMIQCAIQAMLLQVEGRKIFLAPAWPADWNCSFKLHAPYKTTLEGRIENGEVLDLVVTPRERARDVVIVKPQPCGARAGK